MKFKGQRHHRSCSCWKLWGVGWGGWGEICKKMGKRLLLNREMGRESLMVGSKMAKKKQENGYKIV